MNAKISDFGLSKFGPANEKYTFLFSNPVGTDGYCDPLYAETKLLTKESDVYSFGVVLFEVLCGRLCIDYNNVQNPPLVVLARESYEQNTINEIVYSNIKGEINHYSLEVFATIAYQCLKLNRKERPLMRDVVRALEAALRHQANIEEHASECGGLLVVTIDRGYNLGRKPYVHLHLRQDLRATTKKTAENQVWDETFKFTLDKPSKATLRLMVFTDSWFDHIRGRYHLGMVDISVADVIKKGRLKDTYNFGNGHLRVELQWEPSSFPVKTKPQFMQFMTSFYKVVIRGVKGE
ncbi:hypothetical protein QVD17_21181 [Tagetes erecta]|uniref:C2 domain-containing protein n=1 Tax=Tagetes erecta TaxID=13708 RepID=A0AAD8NRM9_TARER|nr:hypothetical protein QVD17_21181 [Tagetes erecta]